MILLLVLLLAGAVVGYALWPALSGRPRERSIVAPLRAIWTLDETLGRLDGTLAHADATLLEVRDVMVELATVVRRLDGSLTRLDRTVAGAGEAMVAVDQLAGRALPLLATLEKVVTPMAVASRATRLVRRPSGQVPVREDLDEQDLAAYGLVDFGDDDTQFITSVS